MEEWAEQINVVTTCAVCHKQDDGMGLVEWAIEEDRVIVYGICPVCYAEWGDELPADVAAELLRIAGGGE